jgi:Ulp1 family protease
MKEFETALDTLPQCTSPFTSPVTGLAVADKLNNRIHIIDSIPSMSKELSMNPLKEALEGKWEVRHETVCGMQSGGNTCGVFVVHHLKLLLHNVPLTTGNIPHAHNDKDNYKEEEQAMRSQMARELLNQQLEKQIALANKSYNQ